MKKIPTNTLLDQLEADTRKIILQTNYLLQEDPNVLHRQPAPDKWSAVQVIEHLNSYGRYYLPLLDKAVDTSHPFNPFFSPGWLGNYFTRIMLPGTNGQVINKMKAFKAHIPSAETDSKQALDEFLQQEKRMLDILAKARKTDIGKTRIPISLTKLVRLKSGDTLRFVIAHHQRHFVQIANTLSAVKFNEKLKAAAL
jgi:hypothetical protein